MNKNPFSKVMQKKSVRELMRVLEDKDNYQDKAIEAAREELQKRDQSTEAGAEPADQKMQETVEEDEETEKEHPKKRHFRPESDFLRFIVRPDLHQLHTSGSNKLLLTLRFYFFAQALVLFSLLPYAVLRAVGVVEKLHHKGLFVPEQPGLEPTAFVILVIPLFAALREEGLFRLVLGPFSKAKTDIFLSLIMSQLLMYLVDTTFLLYTSWYSLTLLVYALLLIGFALPFYAALRQSNMHVPWIKANWKRIHPFLFYFLAILFAVAHLSTYNLTDKNILTAPLIILPFLAYAFVFNYLRIRLGLVYAILLHFVVDLLIVSAKYPG